MWCQMGARICLIAANSSSRGWIQSMEGTFQLAVNPIGQAEGFENLLIIDFD
jgi:hypothetical protein